MNRTDAPKKQPVPFGINGSREDLLSTTPAGDNQASYDAGFPPVTMILKSAGGLPPKGQDMNQILFELSAIGRWLSAGSLNTFDATFATAIAGYPKGAVLLSDSGTTIYVSTADANTNNPNSVSTGWLNLLSFLGGAPLASPTFTGDPKAPTPTAGDNDTSIATTAFVQNAISPLAPLASPALTGTPTAPTAAAGTNTTQIATMAALQTAINDAHTFAASGYQRLPSGLMIQWGSGLVSTPGTSQTYTLPQAFPTAFYQILISHDDGLSTTTNIAVFAAAPVTSSLTQFSAVGYHLNGAATACGFRYIAIGR